MMNSPWAMLMTFIWPKVSERPSAMRSRTAPILTPVNNCPRITVIRRLRGVGTRGLCAQAPRDGWSGEAGGPVVTLQVGVRLDRLAGVPDLLDQPVGADPADAGGLVDVLGRAVHGDLALRRVEGDA